MDEVPDRLRRLMETKSCPFTWGSHHEDGPGMPRLPRFKLMSMSITLYPLVLDRVVVNVLLAYNFAMNGEVSQAREHVAAAYTPLVAVQLGRGDELVEQYQPALRHLVDATWSYVRLFIVARQAPWRGIMVRSLCDLEEFVLRIPSVKDLGRHQEAALLCARSNVEQFPDCADLARRAVRLNPSEGIFHVCLAQAFFTQGFGSRLLPHVEEGVTAARTGHALRPNEWSYHILVEWCCRVGKMQEALSLLREMMNRFPSSLYVAVTVADSFAGLDEDRSALECYKTALTLLDKAHTDYAKIMVRSTVEDRMSRMGS